MYDKAININPKFEAAYLSKGIKYQVKKLLLCLR